MPFYVYSVEGFPGSKESGRHTEYVQVCGTQILVPEKQWFKLDSVYEEPRRHADWKDEQGSIGRHLADEIADQLRERYGFRGLVIMTDHAPDSVEARRLEKAAEATNREWRKTVIQDFMAERQQAEMTGTGRWMPTPYELECFRLLDIAPPSTIEALQKSQQPVQVTVQVTPEILSAAKSGPVSVKATAPAKAATVIDEAEPPRRSPGEAPLPRL